ncbi:MAG: hypothetical protein M3412_01060, partial [Chloroflexota bacterium]|nr:hypothetical protein [Chloroflexota bacterium]
EARDADVGLAAGNGKGVIFRKGKIVKTVLEEDMLQELTDEINAVVQDRQNGIYDEEPEAENAYKPMITLTAV